MRVEIWAYGSRAPFFPAPPRIPWPFGRDAYRPRGSRLGLRSGASPMNIVGVFRPSILDVPYIAEFLRPWGVPTDIRDGVPRGATLVAIAGWGIEAADRTTARRGGEARRAVPRARGRLPALDPDRQRATPAWSVIVDERGLYYDPSKPSRLEELIAENRTTDTHRRTAGADPRASSFEIQRRARLHGAPVGTAVGAGGRSDARRLVGVPWRRDAGHLRPDARCRARRKPRRRGHRAGRTPTR